MTSRLTIVVKKLKFQSKIQFFNLRKILKFHLISWCGNFVETHSFCRVSGDSPETPRKLPFHNISTPGNQMKLRYFMQCIFYVIVHIIFSDDQPKSQDILRGCACTGQDNNHSPVNPFHPNVTFRLETIHFCIFYMKRNTD